MGYNSKKKGLVIETKRENWQKEKEQKEERTHRPSVGREKIAHDIKIMGHNTLSSKAIRVIVIDHPRKVWRVNKLTGSRLLLLQFSTIRSHDKHKEEKKKRVSTYPSSKGRHEAGDVKLLIVHPLEKPPCKNHSPMSGTQHRSWSVGQA